MSPSYVTELYGAKFDFPVAESAPGMEYMFAALPRSGSTHLALELWRTGVMGAPMEYANPPFIEIMRKRLGIAEDLRTYWNEVKRLRTSHNGVFGFKMFVPNYQTHSSEHPELLPCICAQKVIFLTRSDDVGQAVSYSRAIRSGAWFHGSPGQHHRIYDARHIRDCILLLRFQADFWTELFKLTGATVHTVTYEALVANPCAVVEGIANFLGVQLEAARPVDLPHLQVQHDAESAEWIERFKSDAMADLTDPA